MRLVVTGRDAAGRSVFVRDGVALSTLAFPDGGGFEELWVTKGGAPLADARTALDGFPFFPGAGDTRFRVVKLLPGYLERAGDSAASVPELEADAPGMHTTDSIDFVVVLAGRVELELDDGEKRVVSAGDCVVQRATRHRWIPLGNEPLVMAVVMLGTAPRGSAS
jgi:mannose-6-phosphate isomerase-like protein (cupin superfamily)